MVLNFWSYLKGYVIIKVSGFSVERFINLAMNRNIYISDVHYKNDYVIMRVSIEGFKQLKPISKKTKCKVEILSKNGLPFFLFKYRKRKILSFGILFFLISIYFLSTKIWLIDIEGLHRVDESTMVSFLKNEGLYVSCNKNDVDVTKIQEDVLKKFGDIAWISIDTKGTKATINIKETIEKKEILGVDEPCNIIAKKDGIVEKVLVSKGKAVVKTNDVVYKGDILITGELTVKEDEFGVIKNYVASQGEIYAKTYYEFNFKVPYEYEEKLYTNNHIKDYRYSIFNKKIPHITKKVNYENYTRASVYNQLNLGKNYPLPFIIIKDDYKEFESVKKVRTKEEAILIAEKTVDNRILRELSFDMNIVDKNINIKENSSGIDVYVTIDAVEDIGITNKINLNETTTKTTYENTISN